MKKLPDLSPLQVPAFMDPACADDFASTPEFWPLEMMAATDGHGVGYMIINTCRLVSPDCQVFKHVQVGVFEKSVPPNLMADHFLHDIGNFGLHTGVPYFRSKTAIRDKDGT